MMMMVMVIMVHNADGDGDGHDGEFVPVNLVHTPPKSSSPFGISKPASLLEF